MPPQREDLHPGWDLQEVIYAKAIGVAFDNRSEVAFAATLDTDNGAGVLDTGVYVWTCAGGLQLIARTGTVVPGLGTIAHINPPSNIGSLRPNGRGRAELRR